MKQRYEVELSNQNQHLMGGNRSFHKGLLLFVPKKLHTKCLNDIMERTNRSCFVEGKYQGRRTLEKRRGQKKRCRNLKNNAKDG